MLTVMCPNCRVRFPAPGCCEPDGIAQEEPDEAGNGSGMLARGAGGCYYGGLLVPRGYSSGGGCFINAPTIVHGPAIIQTGASQSCATVNSTGVPLTAQGTNNGDALSRHCPAKSRLDSRSNSWSATREDLRAPSNRVKAHQMAPECQIATTCDLTGGSVTITTPGIQSGGCLIQNTDRGLLVQAPHIEIRPKLSGGGCLVQKRLSTDEPAEPVVETLLTDDEDAEHELDLTDSCCNFEERAGDAEMVPLPSGCQDVPGTRRSASARIDEEERRDAVSEARIRGRLFGGEDQRSSAKHHQHHQHRNQHHGQHHQHHQHHHHHHHHHHRHAGERDYQCQGASVFRSQSCRRSSRCCCDDVDADDARDEQQQRRSQSRSNQRCPESRRESATALADPSAGVQIQVNATVRLPASLGQCTVNITATTNTAPAPEPPPRARNNFNGGGLVQTEQHDATSSSSTGAQHVATVNAGSVGSNERRDGAPTTPVSWLMPCPWSFDAYLMDKDVARLREARKLLQTCGWYHEGLSWQQSESLLKEAPVGRWLMRDSSDSRYAFAVSVQTNRGPTSVRVHYFLGRFRLDAEPRLALAMPTFDCPIKMLEHYVEYSKGIDENRKEVWVDYSGQLYSQIYLTKPLVKEVRSLSHLARIAVNRNKIPTDNLPPLIRKYVEEYPYTL